MLRFASAATAPPAEGACAFRRAPASTAATSRKARSPRARRREVKVLDFDLNIDRVRERQGLPASSWLLLRACRPAGGLLAVPVRRRLLHRLP